MIKFLPSLFLIFFFHLMPSLSHASIDSIKNPQKDIMLSKIEVTKLTVDKKKEEEFHKIIYREDGYVEKIEIAIIETYGVDGEGLIKKFNKREKEFCYNDEGQLIQQCVYTYKGANKIEVYQAIYTYDKWGYLDTFAIQHKDTKKIRKLKYNEHCILSHAVREMSKINYNITWDYHYDDKNNLIKLDLKAGEDGSNNTSYIFDDKKNPKQLLFSDKFCLAFPEEYGKTNPKQVIEVGKKYIKKDVFENTYNSLGYLNRSINRHFEKDKLKSTITTKYIYK